MGDRSLLGQTPIPGDSPGGEPLAGDDDFDALRAEITRDPVLEIPVDWKLVAELSEKLLSDRSKDFTVACYLAVGLTQNEGLAGFRDGLNVLVGITENFWDTAHPPVPKRVRGRVNALGFLSEKCSPLLAEFEPKVDDSECVAECVRLLEEIETLFGDRVEGFEIPLGDLSRTLRDLAARVPTPSAPPSQPGQDDTPASSSSPPQSSAGASGSGTGTVGSGEIKSRSDAESVLLRVSTYLKENDPRDPLGYRLPRIVDFGELSSEPPDEGGRLMIPGPEPSSLSSMRALRVAGDWLALAETADNVCRSNPLCLDAHRQCSTALAALGGPYQGASDGIRDEVKSLLRRVPRLARLQFSDGTPLADPETQDWLRDDADAPAPIAGSLGSEVDPEELETARIEAKELARKGDLPSALARLEATLAADPSPRGRFLGRLELAELCVATGHDRVALPMLSELDDTLIRHGLEAWEPWLSRRLLELYYQCRKRLAVGDDIEADEALARAEKLYDRLCRVDPVAAAALE